MFLNDDDKQIVHFILKSRCINCGLDVEKYLSYNQFIRQCPRSDCKEMMLIKRLIKSEHHHNIEDYLGAEYTFNDEWKRFFGCRKGWI